MKIKFIIHKQGKILKPVQRTYKEKSGGEINSKENEISLRNGCCVYVFLQITYFAMQGCRMIADKVEDDFELIVYYLYLYHKHV